MTSQSGELTGYLNRNRHSLLSYGIPAVLSFLLYVYVASPLLNKAEEKRFLTEDLKQKIASDTVFLKEEKTVQEDLLKARELIADLSANMHSSGAGEKLVQQTLNKAKENNLKVAGLEADKMIKGKLFDEISLKTHLEGSFTSTVRFIHSLEKEKPGYSIDGLNMKTDARGALSTTLIIHALVKHDEK